MVAEARGAEKSRILLYHAFPNALPPLLHAIGVGIGALISGAPIVEAVFTWPGLGTYVVSGVAARDLPVVQGFACFATLAYVASSLIMDTLSGLIDPVSLSRKKQ
jgi:peptide/nickel transport system permease protein